MTIAGFAAAIAAGTGTAQRVVWEKLLKEIGVEPA